MNTICFKTNHLQYEISSGGQNTAFSLHTGKNRIVPGPCAKITLQDYSEVPAVQASFEDDTLTVTFANGTIADITVKEHPDYLTFTLKRVSNEDFLSLSFVNIELDDEPENFYGTLIGMTLSTHMFEHPGDNRMLIASAYPHIGLFSTNRSPYPAKAAVIGASSDQLRAIERLVLDEIPDGELPKSKKGGPYADLAAKEAQGIYSIFMDTVTLDNIDVVLDEMKRFGINQVNLHHYGHYIHGDYRCYEEFFPNGMADFKKVVDRFHEEGILVGLQPYSFFVLPQSTYVSPVPHPDLDTLREFTLQADIDPASETLRVEESTEGITPEESYVLVNSPYLWIDDEFVKFSKVENGCFTLAERGSYKTIPSAHKKGAKVRQLKKYFMLPCAKAGSQLFYEIAQNIAHFYNECGADMFYMDALDGSFILDGEDYVWYHAIDFIREMFAHLDRDPIFNCCFNPQYTGSWFVRTRYGAMDTPMNAHRKFIDAHVKYNYETAVRMGVTPELGWIDLYTKNREPDKWWQNDPIYAEDLEYICAKTFATGASLGFLETFRHFGEQPCSEAYAEILQKYAEYRKKHTPTEATTKYLSQNGNAAYIQDDVLYKAHHEYAYLEEANAGFTVENPFEEQIPKFRLEALASAGDYNDPNAITLWDLDETKPIKTQSIRFEAPVSSNGNRGLGVWCKGDGSGALICIKIRNLSANKRKSGEHYIRADFTGWKYFAFYENQNSALSADEWPRTDVTYRTYSELQVFYGHYRVNLDYNAIDGVDIEVKGSENIYLKPLRFVPHIKTAWDNPTIHFGDTAICVHTKLNADSVLYFDGKSCKVTDYIGTLIETPDYTQTPVLPSGKTHVSVSHTGSESPVRAKLTVSLTGEKLM
ncbi:MAG: hypothetical protein II997_03305 [Clostridia bacterium]|nr:hypothetical protein [Clostridia bacterium]